MRSHHDQVEVVLAERLRKLADEDFQATVDLQNHLPHQGMLRTGLVAQQLGRSGEHAEKIERGPQAQPFLDDQLVDEVELGTLCEGGSAVQLHEFLRAVLRPGQGAERRRVGPRSQRQPADVVKTLHTVLAVVPGQPPRHLAAGSHLAFHVHPVNAGVGRPGTKRGVGLFERHHGYAGAGLVEDLGGERRGDQVFFSAPNLFAQGAVVPIVRHDAVLRRPGAGGEGGDTGRREGTGEIPAIVKHRTFFREEVGSPREPIGREPVKGSRSEIALVPLEPTV